MAELKKPGTYELLEFRVSPFERQQPFIDIRGLIHEWELVESMDSGHIYGSATVYDSVGLLDDFVNYDPRHPWLKGEEQIKIVYKDFYSERDPLIHKMFLYAITDVNNLYTSQNTTRYYKIHFTSIDKFLTERYSIRRGFRDSKISDNVQTIYNEYYIESPYNQKKPIEITETEENQNLVVPNYSPEQTMYFFARKAYSSNHPTQTWRFFENRESYYFTTHEDLAGFFADDIVRYIKIDNADKTPEGNLLLQQSLLEINYPTYINTFEDLIEGAYYSSVTELDFINRSPSFVEFRYLDEYDQYSYWPSPNVRSKHSKDFIDKHLSLVKDHLVIKDYGSPNDPGSNNFVRPETYYPQMYNDKRINHYHHNNQSFTVKVYGNNKVMAGSIIELDLEKVDNENKKKKDDLRTGKYLVESVRNIFSEEMYYQILTISNSGIIGEKERSVEYERDRQALSSYTETFNETRVGRGPENDGQAAVDGTSESSTNDSRRKLTNAEVDEILQGEDSEKARQNAESYLGRDMSDEEWNNLVAATVAESLPNSPKEQAYIMGVILNRTKNNYGGWGTNVTDQLNAPNQFQAVTGTSANNRQPSTNFTDPDRNQVASTIDGVNSHLSNADSSWFNFTSNITSAYGAGTDISFRDKVRNSPNAEIVGGTVFGTVS